MFSLLIFFSNIRLFCDSVSSIKICYNGWGCGKCGRVSNDFVSDEIVPNVQIVPSSQCQPRIGYTPCCNQLVCPAMYQGAFKYTKLSARQGVRSLKWIHHPFRCDERLNTNPVCNLRRYFGRLSNHTSAGSVTVERADWLGLPRRGFGLASRTRIAGSGSNLAKQSHDRRE